jgi:pyruvate dehydrogenase E1 component beta subunit
MPDEVLQPGRALVTRPGGDLTLVGYSYTAKLALQAAVELATRGVAAEVIDLRSVSPLDAVTVADSVQKTGRLLVIQEAYKPFGVGAEVIARVAAQRLSVLKAPMDRIAVPFMPIPASKVLEQSYLPSVGQVAARAMQMMGA